MRGSMGKRSLRKAQTSGQRAGSPPNLINCLNESYQFLLSMIQEKATSMARLRYVSTDMPGYTRKKQGRGFTYLDEQGGTIRDPDVRQWINALVIPPAWMDVWICPYPDGHILATGRDDKGRKQYIYHPQWQEVRSQKKFDSLYDFGQALPHLRAVTDEHLRQRKLSRERVLAALVRLLESTLIRVGNDEY